MMISRFWSSSFFHGIVNVRFFFCPASPIGQFPTVLTPLQILPPAQVKVLLQLSGNFESRTHLGDQFNLNFATIPPPKTSTVGLKVPVIWTQSWLSLDASSTVRKFPRNPAPSRSMLPQCSVHLYSRAGHSVSPDFPSNRRYFMNQMLPKEYLSSQCPSSPIGSNEEITRPVFNRGRSLVSEMSPLRSL